MTEQQSMTDTARSEAADVARTAAERGGQVAGTAGDQASRVASEATRQARDLLREGRGQLTEQAREGQRKAATGLRALSDQLHQMAERSDEQGTASEVVRQAAERTSTVASWLEDREPGDLLDEVRRFARRKPGVFLAGAALAGVVVGRLTRGAIDAKSDDDSGASGAQYNGGAHRLRDAGPGPLPSQTPPAGPGYGTTPPADPGFGATPAYGEPAYGTTPPPQPAPGYGAVPPAPPATPGQTPGYSMPPNPQPWER
jgi:hypothetical protein